MTYPKPIPKLRGEEQIYFQRAHQGDLVYQRCEGCGARLGYPRVVCPVCFGVELEIVTASGGGVVHSFTTLHRPGKPAFADDVPYTIVLVDLDEGVRVIANLVTDDQDSVSIGMRVRVIFDRVTEDFTLPRFVPDMARAANDAR